MKCISHIRIISKNLNSLPLKLTQNFSHFDFLEYVLEYIIYHKLIQ